MMKVRMGFVSNSSSASFVASCANYRDVFDLAQTMIRRRGWKDDKKLIEYIDKCRETASPNHPLAFRTCNYDTFILRLDDYFIVQTCNNHDFSGIGSQYLVPSHLHSRLRVMGYDGDDFSYDEMRHHLQSCADFWYPEYDITGRPSRSGFDWCYDHYYDKIEVTTGEIICPDCQNLYLFVNKGVEKKVEEVAKILWEILLPTVADGKPVIKSRHREWDEKIRKLTGAPAMFASTDQWINPEDAEERLLPVRVLANADQMDRVAEITLAHYNQQSVMFYVLSDQVKIKAQENVESGRSNS